MNTKGDSEISDIADDDQEHINSNLVVFPKRIPSTALEEIIDEQTFNKIKKLLTCPICLEIFIDPVYVKTCSHRFCKRCIEKCLRSSAKVKQCPACRQAISTKRTLKEDQNVSNISQLNLLIFQYYQVQKIFPDINAYKLKETKIEDKQFEELYHFKIENSLPIAKRTNSKRQESSQIQLTYVKEEEVIQKKVCKEEIKEEQKQNIAKPSSPEFDSLEEEKMMQEIIKEYMKTDISREDLVEAIQLLQNDAIKMEMNWILSVRLLTHPDDILTKQIDPAVSIVMTYLIKDDKNQHRNNITANKTIFMHKIEFKERKICQRIQTMKKN